MTSEAVIAVLNDTDLSPSACRIVLYVASLGPGQHRISASFLAGLIDRRSRQKVEKALRLGIDAGYIAARPDGRFYEVAYGPGSPHFPNTRRIPPKVREAVLERDAYRCVWCGSTDDPHLDHVVPFSAGGEHTPENLRVLCARCNLERGNAGEGL